MDDDALVEEVIEEDGALDPSGWLRHLRFVRLEITNFLSYQSATLEFSRFMALVGPNSSGKSNAVSAIKLLREVAVYGLPVALARRGGFDQLRHRSAGRPYDPALKLTFELSPDRESYYELRLGAVKGGRYRVKREVGLVRFKELDLAFESDGRVVRWEDENEDESDATPLRREFRLPPGQTALSSGSFAAYLVGTVLRQIQTVEVNPAKVSELQEPSSTQEFEPDGSNVVTIYENLDAASRRNLTDELAVIVPNIESIQVSRLADRLTLRFQQKTERGVRGFYAKQMSDGTLRALAILLAATNARRHALLVIEEPEIAIHLGALRTLVDLLSSRAEHTQIVITTHSADIVDALPVDDIRIVWTEDDASHIAPISEHSLEPVRRGLITPGELLRSDSLDPAT